MSKDPTDPAPLSGPEPDPAPSGPEPDPAADDEPLGEPGKRALQIERTARKDAEAARAAAVEELDRLKMQHMTDQEKAIAVARRDAAAEERTRWTERAIALEVTAEAAKAGAVDPDAVATLIPRDAITVDKDGQVSGITDAVAALLRDKPYLVRVDEPKFQGGVDQGPKGARPAGTITREDLKNMSAEEIVAARRDGRLAHLGA